MPQVEWFPAGEGQCDLWTEIRSSSPAAHRGRCSDQLTFRLWFTACMLYRIVNILTSLKADSFLSFSKRALLIDLYPVTKLCCSLFLPSQLCSVPLNLFECLAAGMILDHCILCITWHSSPLHPSLDSCLQIVSSPSSCVCLLTSAG